MPVDAGIGVETPADAAFARVLTAGAEALAHRHGFGRRENLRFQLAVEEFFGCLVQVADPERAIEVRLTSRRHQLRATFRFVAASLCLGGLNVTAVTTVDADGEPARDLGLLLAGKVADRFHLAREDKAVFELTAEVDRTYPPAAACPSAPAIRPPYAARVCDDPAQLAHGAALATARYPAWHLPRRFAAPGKFADMVAEGLGAAVAAFDAAGHLAGLMCWSPSGEKGLEFSGPFVFAPPADAPAVARLLTDAFLAAVAREPRDLVFSFRATPDAPAGYFEPLGSLDLGGPGGSHRQDVLYRHLREDAGGAVWCHPDLEGFLRRAYDDLALCRDILPATRVEGVERRQSLLSATLDHGKGLAELRLLLDGEDLAENLAGHVRSLADKGVATVLFYLDLAEAAQAATAGELLRAGFSPRLVLPCAGRGDVVVFQHVRAA